MKEAFKDTMLCVQATNKTSQEVFSCERRVHRELKIKLRSPVHHMSAPLKVVCVDIGVWTDHQDLWQVVSRVSGEDISHVWVQFQFNTEYGLFVSERW